jgi:SagB-type dehydrogenase family enzyme
MAEASLALAYHRRTTHRPERYAAGPETLDWDEQPDPFRVYEGAPRTVLALATDHLTASFADLHRPGAVAPRPLTLEGVAALLRLSFGLSAWKEQGPDRWALRCNPSSGNLHPTEAYVLARRVPGLADGLHHYVSRDHVLERRCRMLPMEGGGAPGLWIGLSSLIWREAWKYGERAFRYCQLDLGHAIAAIRYAAGLLGWRVRLVRPLSGEVLGAMLGLDRDQDFGAAEREEPEAMLEIRPGRVDGDGRAPDYAPFDWTGVANRIDPHPMYRWPVIDEVARATAAGPGAGPEEGGAPALPAPDHGATGAAALILGRRSAQRFDRAYEMPAADLFRLADSLLVRPNLPPWDVWSDPPALHPVLFVHRVAGLAPGLYALPRTEEAADRLRRRLDGRFDWRRAEGAPDHLPLYALGGGDCRAVARTLHCHQAIAADSAVALGLFGGLEDAVTAAPWRYRQLHWEAGLLGHVLYLEAEAMGLRGTGIGCFFDEEVEKALGLDGAGMNPIYHFTVGRAVLDTRITTHPPYPAAEPA